MRWLFLIVLLVGGCDGPTEGRVRADFLAQHPGAEVVSATPGEGDSDHVHYHVRFRRLPATTVQEVEWGYQQTSDGRWHVFHRGAEPAGRPE
jgi:hypothetical protein